MDAHDDQKRIALIAERLMHWKAIKRVWDRHWKRREASWDPPGLDPILYANTVRRILVSFGRLEHDSPPRGSLHGGFCERENCRRTGVPHFELVPEMW